MRFIISLVEFQIHKRFYNPSRVDPSLITHLTGPNSRRDRIFLAPASNSTELGVALSVILVNEL
jgi:hypothetical protein